MLTGKAKLKRKSITMKEKLDIIMRMERGDKQKDITAATGLAGSTIYTILKNKEKIQQSAENVIGGTKLTKVSRSRHAVLERMEVLLLHWIENQNEKNIPLSTMSIQHMALLLFEGLKKKMLEEGDETVKAVEFGASKGWFDRFRRRGLLHTLKLSGQVTSADGESAATFPKELQNVILEGSYDPRQVFNMDETGLFWKRMPSRMLASQEGRKVSGHETSKDRLTLLLGGNLKGDVKLKPLLVYHAENPRALKGVIKSSLPVVWRSNRKTWVTQEVFIDYIRSYFSPFVEQYCKENSLPNKALLIIDDAPGHTADVRYADNVEVLLLPPNTTSLLQPMDQGVKATFKAYYLQLLMKHLVNEAEKDSSLKDVWRQFDIKMALCFMAEAWQGIKPETMNAAWSKLCPHFVHGFKGFSQDDIQNQIRQRIVHLAGEAGFTEVDEADVENVLTSHTEELLHTDMKALRKVYTVLYISCIVLKLII
uniref:HTH CENPB-type domain-containing protein n=1 Tax=Scleropages formosus TaxID=113540 RepID=A0A8C9SH57_SCLFO